MLSKILIDAATHNFNNSSFLVGLSCLTFSLIHVDLIRGHLRLYPLSVKDETKRTRVEMVGRAEKLLGIGVD
jgi:hypothetical protein